MSEYKVKFEVFEGPLDLLLYLIKKEEVDIYEVNLTKLATQFIEYIDLMREFDLEIAGEFLVMASTLMYIKSRELLPVDQQAQVEGEEEGEDPRWELIRQLVEYKKFKDAAANLQALEAQPGKRLSAAAGQTGIRRRSPGGQAGRFHLRPAQCRQRRPQALCRSATMPREIFEDKWTVSEKIEHARSRLIEQRRACDSPNCSRTPTSRTEVVCTFLALLELIRLKQLVCGQRRSLWRNRNPDSAQYRP